MSSGMRVVYNHLPELEAAMKAALSEITRKAALDVEAGAKERAKVKSGFMRNSIYTVTHEESTYGQGTGEIPKGASLLPEIDRAENEQTAYVAVGANYGIYVEMGTSKMAAQPYLIPAADAARPGYVDACSRLEAAMKAKAGL